MRDDEGLNKRLAEEMIGDDRFEGHLGDRTDRI